MARGQNDCSCRMQQRLPHSCALTATRRGEHARAIAEKRSVLAPRERRPKRKRQRTRWSGASCCLSWRGDLLLAEEPSQHISCSRSPVDTTETKHPNSKLQHPEKLQTSSSQKAGSARLFW